MNAPRWLLPFTHGVDMGAIDSVVRFAQSAGATLVPVTLIAVPHERRSRGVRLEHIQQSKDFLEAVQFKAARLEVPVERYEVFTGDVLQSIALLVQDLRCDSIVLVTGEQREMLLHASELKRLLMEPPAALVLMRPGHRPGTPTARAAASCAGCAGCGGTGTMPRTRQESRSRAGSEWKSHTRGDSGEERRR